MTMIQRLRRSRRTAEIRALVAETRLSVDDFIMPYFVVEGINVKKPIETMPEVFRFSIDNLLKDIEELSGLGVKGVLLFGVPDKKNPTGSYAYKRTGIIQKAVSAIKKKFPGIAVITDVCMCSYTSAGHCGIVKNGIVQNDDSLAVLSKIALSHADAGADIVAPSAMMDGQVGAIREILDSKKCVDVAIMAYSAKYASGFYAPFRDAADSSPKFGDRKSYQMDYRNVKEALRESAADLREGADILMVKPALSYLDVIRAVKEHPETSIAPLAAYNVSGEYSMVKAAAMKGWLDEKKTAMEILTSIKRAGADIIITYFAKQAAGWIKEDE
ncbi:MAG: delta-aminolevulinic acid dehydratase [Candidatus Firestonebacteria bacterium RIFOXYC2_FULL_39_67]|nr:MAG: delta-aminolevulinic acid dehydratase [Candidatus Firestonebacteria bacterium RIFOXYC2_FULL_39_67]